MVLLFASPWFCFLLPLGCFSLPFLPVLIILGLACLPAVLFATFIFVMSALVGPLAPGWCRLPNISDGGRARHALGLVVNLLQSSLAPHPTLTSPDKKNPVDITTLPRRDQFLLIFRAFDLDNSGELNMTELTAVGKALKGDEGWTDSRSLDFLQRLGKKEGDGITPEDFVGFLDDATKSIGKDKVDNYVRRWVHAARRARTPERARSPSAQSTTDEGGTPQSEKNSKQENRPGKRVVRRIPSDGPSAFSPADRRAP